MSGSSYLAVLKALYDYETPQSEDELAIKEDQLLFLLEKVDDDWWKVKIKPDSPDEDGPSGLVPAAYVEEVPHKHVVKVLYDYEANASGELTVKEDEILYSYETDEGWVLVKSKDKGMVGYVPGNYIEQAEGEQETETSHPQSASPSPSASSAPALSVQTSSQPTRNSISVDKLKADDIQTWSLSELDKKGKKKKGTLGVGNGALFFASESDKTPVQKWSISDVDAVRTEKSKHIIVEIGGAQPVILRFHAASKDTAEAVLKKLERSIDISSEKTQATIPATHTIPTPRTLPPIETTKQESPKKNQVHFAASSPSIITRSEDGDEEVPAGAVEGIVLYDFTAGGDDELTVNEADHLWVLDRSNEDWWSCRNQHGLEGVVPASYIELADGIGQAESTGLTEGEGEGESGLNAAHEAAEREEQMRRDEEERERQAAQKREREEREARRKEKEKVEVKRRELEQQRKREAERRAAEETEAAEAVEAIAAVEVAEAAAKKDAEARERERQARRAERKANEKPRSFPKTTRTWHDKTGQFQVDAEYLGQHDNKIRLHKSNGVIIEVPISKMSSEDMEYVRRLQRKKAASSRSANRTNLPKDEDDVPLGSLPAASNKKSSPVTRSSEAEQRNAPPVDWFEFFLNAGCDIDECTRYASSFERDKIDASLLPELKDSTLRSLGLKEGDILRVLKFIQLRYGTSIQNPDTEEKPSQMEEDEKLARQLQAQENGMLGERGLQGGASPAPNLFSGPGGVLKNNTRRGRPQPSKSAPPANVDISSIGADQPSTSLQTLTPVRTPKPTTSTTPSQFEDEAWTNRPSSTVPIAPSPTATVVPTPPLSSVPTQVRSPITPALGPPIQASSPTVTSPPANDSNFELLAKISAMRPVASQSSALPTPSFQSPPPPTGFQSGLGVGTSSLPISQHLQNQQIGLYNLQQSQPRGPLAPTPANQPLLNPLIPTNTGFNSFIPTRPGTNPPTAPPLPSFLSSPPNFRSQSNPSNPILPQPSSVFGGPQSQPTSFNSVSLQTQPTGFNPKGFEGIQSGSIFNSPSLQPGSSGGFPNFLPPATSSPPDNHSPANVFAQMKSGTFGKDAPQSAGKYDPLRMSNSSQVVPQWGVQPDYSTFQSGFH